MFPIYIRKMVIPRETFYVSRGPGNIKLCSLTLAPSVQLSGNIDDVYKYNYKHKLITGRHKNLPESLQVQTLFMAMALLLALTKYFMNPN